jgi:DNA-binding transcriptional LysR family regulator
MARTTAEWKSRIGRRPRLRDLHILSTVVEWGSMGKAASHLAMSQPAVSEAIADLEDTLGVKLLDRSPRGVDPTIYATALLKRGRVVFDELVQGIRDIDFLANPRAGEVRIGCPESLTAGFLPAIIDRLSRRYPQIVVHAIHAESGTLEFSELRRRNIDLMLARISEPFLDPELDAEILFQERYFVVAGARSRWVRRRKIELAELADERWIQMPENTYIDDSITEAFRAHGLEMPRKSVISFSANLRTHLLATGRFLTVVSASVLQFNAKAWSLKALPIDLNVQKRCVAVITVKNRTLSPVVQLFIDHARAVATSIPGTADPHRRRAPSIPPGIAKQLPKKR